MQYEKTHLRVDDATIAAGDPWAVIRPVSCIANMYGGPAEYEQSLRRFSQAQRQFFALNSYTAEVNNGGHDQFYFNSTGIVWRDALEACQAIGALGLADILQQSAERLGGSPSPDRGERQQQLSELAPNFNDLDNRFYAIEESEDVDRRVMNFIRARPADFYFDGIVELPVSSTAEANRQRFDEMLSEMISLVEAHGRKPKSGEPRTNG